MKRVRNICATLLVIVLIAAISYGVISSRKVAGGSDLDKVVVVSPHPIEFMKPLVNEFESETGITVEILQCGHFFKIQRVELVVFAMQSF